MKHSFLSSIVFIFVATQPASVLAKTYKQNGGYCDMIAIHDTVDQYGQYKRKKGTVLQMVGTARLPDGTLMVSEYRCCDFNIKHFKYIDDCRLPID